MLGVALLAAAARADHDPLHRNAGGYSIYVGVVPAGIMAFREDHCELRMHGGAAAYANFFRMRQGVRYRLELHVRRAGSPAPVAVSFDYRHRF